ncbi:YjiH family protein [Vibrio sp.]|nr:YjiH family protein [Vibrio sp.]
MAPVNYDGSYTIPIAVLAKSFQMAFADYLVALITIIISLMAVSSIIYRFLTPSSSSFIHNLLRPSIPWLLVRLIGAIAAIATYYQMGPQALWEENTGGLVLEGLLPTLLSVFIFAGFLLPLLLNFGLLEFFGTLFSRIMRPIFNLPGRGAVDCITSWLGDGSVGVLLTSKQYEDKFYTQREAAVIGTTFSAVSITFSLIVIAQVNLESYFVPFYAAVCLAGFVAAIIVPRLPPLSKKSDTFIDGSTPNESHQKTPQGYSSMTYGFELALKKANSTTSYRETVKEGAKNAIDMVFGVLPVVMGIGTIALIIAEYTPIFSWLGMPFVPYLELLQIPEATVASETIVVGFADMFIPAILAASSVESDLTRFVIAAVSVTQLIYMSEIGALMLGSKIPINIVELFMIFILRTLVTLPIIAGIAHLIF